MAPVGLATKGAYALSLEASLLKMATTVVVVVLILQRLHVSVTSMVKDLSLKIKALTINMTKKDVKIIQAT